ncbi:hypothetical protein PC110_g9343 [Phytophthora cactorum]|uniref:TIR domain-containing protein n=4 Tax=Phytophthora cactorum TaxID=29920 RepID=A0A329SBR7_9STRA|nr:hypothetical protein PC110_g9343 [Phytophthora cactorum]
MKHHYQNVKSLHGKLSEVPRHWLWLRFLNNSFFARRLMRSGLQLSVGLAVGVIFNNIFVQPNLDTYEEENPDLYDECLTLVGFSAVIYQTLPAAIVLSLPGSGLRFFEPFKRTSPSSGQDTVEEGGPDPTNMTKVRRRFVFQLCEVLAVCMLLFDFCLVAYFLRVLFTGAIDSCGSISTRVFALGAAFCYAGFFVVIYYFARYREHIKMQLGAFQEADQTGDVRKYVDLRSDQKLNTTAKLLGVVRVRLYYATRRGDLEEMREILEFAKAKGLTDVGFPDKVYAAPKIRWKFFARSRENPVHVAALLGNTRALELLEEYGFSMEELDKVRRVVVSTGGFFWHFVQLIVKRPQGSNEDTAVSVFHTSLVTPLHCAVSTGQFETVRWLLAQGVSPGTLAQASFRSNRVPPLFLAEHADIIRELLVHGADPLVIPDPGFMNTMTPLQLAYVRGNYAVAQELEEWGSDVALTPFHLAAAHNDVAAVRKFIARKTDVDCLGEMGYVGVNRRTPLHWAAISGSSEAVDALLEGGADPNFQDVRGRSPLHWAAKLNKLEVVRSLLRANADPNLADGEFMTPLMCAASALDASRELVSELTAAGGDIGYQLPTTGDTALHVAVREENEASALAVLASGGDLMRMNNEGLRPLDCTASTRTEYDYDESRYRSQFHLLLDGVRDEVEKHRYVTKQKNLSRSRRLAHDSDGERSNQGTMLQTLSDMQLSTASWDPNSTNTTNPDDMNECQFVFLSHGDKHSAFVQQFAAQLLEAGIPCYSDQNVSGRDFYTRIQASQQAILRCSCFVVLVSRQTIRNELVRDQLAFAEDKGRPIFPVVLNDVDPGLDKRYTLVRSELFHFMANGMGFKPSFDTLVRALRLHGTFTDGVLGSTPGSEASQTRNLDSIEGLEDNQLNLSGTRVRM